MSQDHSAKRPLRASMPITSKDKQQKYKFVFSPNQQSDRFTFDGSDSKKVKKTTFHPKSLVFSKAAASPSSSAKKLDKTDHKIIQNSILWILRK
jgi:hypothetical protein